jgi:CDP-ribitol ribitolphosphotransferase
MTSLKNSITKTYEKNIKKDIYEQYPIIKEKKNILYCPTFRKDEKEFNKALNKLIKAIDFNKYNLIVKLHPLSKTIIEDNKNIIIDKDYETFDMLFVADYVISDYSCIIYEAGVRNIPLYFYNFDFKSYKTKRGLALNYDELPGYTSSNPNELIKSLEKEYDMKYYKKFMKKYVENTKDCTKKVVEIIEEYM